MRWELVVALILAIGVFLAVRNIISGRPNDNRKSTQKTTKQHPDSTTGNRNKETREEWTVRTKK